MMFVSQIRPFQDCAVTGFTQRIMGMAINHPIIGMRRTVEREKRAHTLRRSASRKPLPHHGITL